MDMDTAIAIFTDTLQQFVNSLQGQVRTCVMCFDDLFMFARPDAGLCLYTEPMISYVPVSLDTGANAVMRACIVRLEPML